MKKQRIVLASVLKPVDDTRMFEKLGKSLSADPDFEVYIIGYPSQKPPNHPAIQFISSPKFSRISLQRLLTPLNALKKIHEVKPDLLIVNTHELLMVAVASRIFFGTKIIYDVQENYWRNILWTDTYPPFFRQLLAIWVRVKEVVLAGFFQLFILAEKGFEKEMKFFRNKFIVLENKSSLPADLPRTKSSDAIRLLFSGTISESTGVFQAIHLAYSLYQLDHSVSLHIIGYCAVPSTLERVRQLIKDKPYILLSGGSYLVPHEDIIYQISSSAFGIIYYPYSPHIENKIPTKLYEYLSARLPILIQEYQPWLERCAPYQAAIPINFNATIDAALLLNKMKRSSFYTKAPKDVFWSSEEKKLLISIKKF